MLRRGRAAWMTSHKQPSFFIWNTVASSSVVHLVHLARLVFGFSSAWCTLQLAAASWRVETFAGASLLEQISNALDQLESESVLRSMAVWTQDCTSHHPGSCCVWRSLGRTIPDTQRLVSPLLPQRDSEKFVRHGVARHWWRSTNIRHQPGAARRQSQVWRLMAPQGGEAVRAGALRCACGRWLGPRQALRVAFVALQVVVLIPSIAGAVTVICVHGMGLRSCCPGSER
jgi:hypothetical protein